MSLRDAAMRMAQSKLMRGGSSLSGATDLAPLLQSRHSDEKLEPWQKEWVDQLVSIMESGFAGMPAIPNIPGARELVRSKMTEWVQQRSIEDARETAQVMMATAQQLLSSLPASTVEYPPVPKVEE